MTVYRPLGTKPSYDKLTNRAYRDLEGIGHRNVLQYTTPNLVLKLLHLRYLLGTSDLVVKKGRSKRKSKGTWEVLVWSEGIAPLLTRSHTHKYVMETLPSSACCERCCCCCCSSTDFFPSYLS